MNFFLISLIKTGVVAGALLTTLAYLQWIERKVLAHIQMRLGPYRVGPHGLLQPLADVLKLTMKEGYIPSHVNVFFYLLAPFLAVTCALISICMIPFGPSVEIFGYRTDLGLADLNIGVLFVLAVTSVGVYGIALAGWSSNNKYSLMGGLRSSAQMISYELPMTIALVSPLLLINDLSLRTIVNEQGGYYLGIIPKWSIFQLPFPQLISFLIFLISSFAETNRVPFDLPEAENELVAGFHTEYSSLGFACFFMAEYANMITATCMSTVLFLGGWHAPFPAEYGSDFVPVLLLLAAAAVLIYQGVVDPKAGRKWDRFSLPVAGLGAAGLALVFLIPVLKPILIPIFWFTAKTGFLLFVFIWIRGTLPRFRYDQLMNFTWKFLFPLSILNLLATALLVALAGEKS
ncbi:MAG: complex I subunit 1 family protein [Bryobacter sp.]|nr:complex I subunit 1 family protein [Bryobacter sp.]